MIDLTAILNNIPDLPGALCAQIDPDSWYPENGRWRGADSEAKAVCEECEVRVQCLEWALEHDERYGIWGGLSANERARLKRVRPAGDAA
jgi:WhiB family redox-sensing transcriptional regulator